MATVTEAPLKSPQDRLVERVCSSEEDDSGRYVIAKDDISPGEIVLLAAPYAVALNPNEAVSAMYVAANVEEWEDASMGELAGRRVGQRVKKSGNIPTDGGEYVALSPCVTFCSCCLRRIPTGTPFLNCETIEVLSHLIAVEHVESENAKWEKERESHQRTGSDAGDAADLGDRMHIKKEKKLQKSARSAKMRSKGYLSLKQRLLEAATAQRESAMYEAQKFGGALGDSSRNISWPERVVEKHVLEEDLLVRGACGCAGCGVAIYCSKSCWQSFNELHRATGACRVLRDVYSPLMRIFLSRITKGNKGGSAEIFCIDSWSPKHWLRRTTDAKAWEMLQLLLAALLVGRCAKEGYANNMREEEKERQHPAENVDDYYSEEEDRVWGTMGDEESASPRDCDHLQVSNTPNTGTKVEEDGGSDVSITVNSAIPREAEVIRLVRSRMGTAVEVLDSGVNECGKCPRSMGRIPMSLCVSIKDHIVLGIRADGSETHAIQCPQWPEAAALVTNLSVLRKESRSVFRRYYRRFCLSVLPWLNCSEGTDEPLSVSSSFFDRLCGAVQCNNFGLFDPKEDCIGVSVIPEASYFNHSCLPNLCRVMCDGGIAAFYALREIRKGEPLTICYVDVQEVSTAERRRTLLTSYRFFCQCKRCNGSSVVDDKTDADAAKLRLCGACAARGYLRPLPPTDAAILCRWTMDSIATGECTVCHNRAPWGGTS